MKHPVEKGLLPGGFLNCPVENWKGTWFLGVLKYFATVVELQMHRMKTCAGQKWTHFTLIKYECFLEMKWGTYNSMCLQSQHLRKWGRMITHLRSAWYTDWNVVSENNGLGMWLSEWKLPSTRKTLVSTSHQWSYKKVIVFYNCKENTLYCLY